MPSRCGLAHRTDGHRRQHARPHGSAARAVQPGVTVSLRPMRRSSVAYGSAPSPRRATRKFCCAGDKRHALPRRLRAWISTLSRRDSWSVCTRVWYGSLRWTNKGIRVRAPAGCAGVRRRELRLESRHRRGGTPAQLGLLLVTDPASSAGDATRSDVFAWPG
jgi:hypothetical protein